MTNAHRRISEELHRQGYRHENEVYFRAPSWPYGYRADIYVPGRRVVVEIDGPSHDGRRRHDRIRDSRFRNDLGVRTVRVTNHEVERDTYRAALKIIRFA
jgi:very-short-patch-repair endonuclease